MPSVQVSLVIETEKAAAGIEQDARVKARQILDAAKMTAAANRKSIDKSTDAIIENIKTDAAAQADTIISNEALAASGLISALRSTAGSNKDKTILDAVHALSGRT